MKFLADFNTSGLKRLFTVYNGILHIGKTRHFIHETYSEEVFAIECLNNKRLELTQVEAINLALRILEEYDDDKSDS